MHVCVRASVCMCVCVCERAHGRVRACACVCKACVWFDATHTHKHTHAHTPPHHTTPQHNTPHQTRPDHAHTHTHILPQSHATRFLCPLQGAHTLTSNSATLRRMPPAREGAMFARGGATAGVTPRDSALPSSAPTVVQAHSSTCKNRMVHVLIQSVNRSWLLARHTAHLRVADAAHHPRRASVARPSCAGHR